MPTPRLGAPEWAEGQALPETTGNEIVRNLEQGAGARSFLSRTTTAPPGSPAEADEYLIPVAATGVWSTHVGEIAFCLNGAWEYVTPYPGIVAFVLDEDTFIGFSAGSTWLGLGLTVDNDTTLSSDSTAAPPSVHATKTYVDDALAGLGTAGATLDTDGTLAANSDSRIATQKAVKTYVDTAVTGVHKWKGATDCSSNPNYPAASKGDSYTVSVAGKIGGASGATVDVGDVFIATADNAGGTQASVGSSWVILEHNLVSALAASFATAAEVRAGSSSSKVIAPDALAAAVDPQALTDAATTAWDMSTAINAEWTIAGNRTLSVSNYRKGFTYVLAITQDATGSRTVTWPASFNWGAAGAPTLSTGAGKTDIVTLYCRDSVTPKFRAIFSKDGL
jgi:hypothetical protein